MTANVGSTQSPSARLGAAPRRHAMAVVAWLPLSLLAFSPRLLAAPPDLPAGQVESLTPLAPDVSRPQLDHSTFRPVLPSKRASHPFSGTWLYRAAVSADGSVSSVEILRGVHPELDPPIQRALLEARFTPATRADRKVPVIVIDQLHLRRPAD